MNETPDDVLETLIRTGWAEHADQPEAVMQRLAARLAEPIAEAQRAGLVGLLVHVAGEHLARWDDGIALLRRLPEADPAARLGIATLALAAGQPDATEGLGVQDRVCARAQAAAALLGRGNLAGAIALFRTVDAEAATHCWPDDAPAVRALAVCGNNLAQTLEDQAERTPDETHAMVQAARTALAHWRRCGGWLEHERAEYRMARSLWRAGQAAEGLAHARHCLALCEAHAAPAFERFFGHAMAAVCARGAADDAALAQHHEQALLAWAHVDVDELPWCASDLADLRAAIGDRHPGRCTCGHVRFALTSRPLFVHACHCRWCQRETGSAFVLNALIETERVQLLAGEPVRVLMPSSSGQGQQILRCPHCHVALWSHYPGAGPTAAFVRVGTLLDPDRLPPDIHIFTSTKQAWLTLSPGVPAVPDYYDREAYWPADSLARRKALLARTANASPTPSV